jgi:hypothetical protein
MLHQLLGQAKNRLVREEFAKGLAVVSGRFAPVETARICAKAIRLLNEQYIQEKDWYQRVALARGIAVLAERMEPAEAARARLQTARTCSRSLSRVTGSEMQADVVSMSFLIQGLDSEPALLAAGLCARRVVSDPLNFPYTLTVRLRQAGVARSEERQGVDISRRGNPTTRVVYPGEGSRE